MVLESGEVSLATIGKNKLMQDSLSSFLKKKNSLFIDNNKTRSTKGLYKDRNKKKPKDQWMHPNI